jgi:fumarate hydratase class I
MREVRMRTLTLPLDPDAIRSLKVGDPLRLDGVIVTGRDAAHKWLVDTFVSGKRAPQGDDEAVEAKLRPLLEGGALYHCGPVVAGLDTRRYRIVAAGPTTSIREEPYQSDVMRRYQVRAVIGKGGMGPKTLAACQEVPSVYLHAIGGAAALIARTMRRVVGVYKLEFGVPEAMWVIEAEGFPAVVTMDAHGASLHREVEARSRAVLEELTAGQP